MRPRIGLWFVGVIIDLAANAAGAKGAKNDGCY